MDTFAQHFGTKAMAQLHFHSHWIGRNLGVAPQAVSATILFLPIGFGVLLAAYLGIMQSAKQYFNVCSLLHGTPACRQHSPAMRVTFLIVAYSLCSSMLLILNKVAVTYMPVPSFLLLCQLSSCALYIRISAAAGMIDAEPLECGKSKAFCIIVMGFIGTLYSNITSLRYVPVDTLVCFRASCPMVLAVIEAIFLGRELPSVRSSASLIGVFVGVSAYTWHDVNFNVTGYIWVTIWYSFMIFETIYVKRIIDTVEMTTWSRTYYQNTLAILPVMAMTALSGEAYTLMSLNWKPEAVLALVASCIGGVGMSYFSFALRAVISATSFSVIGNICKVLTILVNLLIWENHSNVIGTVALLCCLGAGTAYQQAPMQSIPRAGEPDKERKDEPFNLDKPDNRV